MLKQVDHIGIAVKNLDDAVKSYKEMFGIEPEFIEVSDEFKVRVAFISIGGVLIEFIEATEDSSVVTGWIEKHGEGINHIAYRVDNIDERLKELKEQGVKLMHEKAVPGGGGSMIAVISPEETNDIITELVERE
jgi:methylmalonyl-CoA/ethylmalonyl-CoA epimerase